MDQDSPKTNPEGVKANWRDKLGITDKLPKISEEFTSPPPTSASADRREPPLTASASPRPGAPVTKPAPMAPRTPAGSQAAGSELAERIRQQREAAERMAEQRVAEAKIRASQEGREGSAPGFLSTGAANSQKPRFTFAEEELKQAQQDSAAQQRAWNAASVVSRPARPVFTAERPSSRVPDPRSRPPVTPPPRSSVGATTNTYQSRPPVTGQPRPPAGLTSAPYQPSGANDAQRPPGLRGRSDPPRAQEPYRGAVPPSGNFGYDEPYGDEASYRGVPRRTDHGRTKEDYRGAHSRELAQVQDESEELFEDERRSSPERKRAGVQDYTQAYREYEGAEEEPPRRRTGPLLLLLAFLGVAAIAGTLIYLYQHSGRGSSQADTEGAVPVVAPPQQEAKTPPDANATPDENTDTGSSAESTQQSENPASAQKKQIYDRILGDTTQEEQNQIAPSEEQPVVPNAAGDNNPEPLPLPLPPAPGGSGNQPSGALDQPSSTQQASAATNDGQSGTANNTVDDGIATPDTPTADSSDTDGTAATKSSAQAVAQDGQDGSAGTSTPSPTKLKAKPTTQPAGTARTADAQAAPIAASDGLETTGGGGAGPIQLTPGQSQSAPATAGTTFSSLPPPLPNLTDSGSAGTASVSPARTIGRRAGDKFVSAANTNFNRAQQAAVPQQVASIDAPATPPAQDATGSQTAVQPLPQPIQQASIPDQTSVPAAQVPAGTAGYVLQLSSFKSEVEAKAEYDKLRQQHGNVIAGLNPEIQKTDLGSRGTFYRLFLGTVGSKPAATTLCNTLLGSGERDCLVKAR